ncbi:hypothetical protein EV421DRAFT_1914265 [Armillaria borealis]|uniref:CCHC-type domain-containing protein n=1 Tax=Armillaria borealis TaxID=47425 RepID=A0AA39ITX6_9AGAR|nr:hypothetical protein EV421DRAFT_1914265 [Armillaria borealis]
MTPCPESPDSPCSPTRVKQEEITPSLHTPDPPEPEVKMQSAPPPVKPTTEGKRAERASTPTPHYGKTVKDKVILQCWRNRDLANTGRTDIADQGIFIDANGDAFIIKGGIADMKSKSHSSNDKGNVDANIPMNNASSSNNSRSKGPSVPIGQAPQPQPPSNGLPPQGRPSNGGSSGGAPPPNGGPPGGGNGPPGGGNGPPNGHNGPARRGSRLPRPTRGSSGRGGAPIPNRSTGPPLGGGGQPLPGPPSGGGGGPPLGDGSQGGDPDESEDDNNRRNYPCPGYHDPVRNRGDTQATDRSHNRAEQNTHALGDHRKQMHDRIEQYTDEHLRVHLHLPDGVKAPRLDSKNVSLYAGSSSVAEFWTWLKSLVIYLETSQLGGLDRDRERKLLIEPVLTGTAKKWYHDHVIEVNEYSNWTFVSVIIGLYDRFIHDSAMQDARSKFDRAMFLDGGGTAEGYHDLLQTLIRDMTRKPDDYSITRRFVTGLPHDMREAVFDDRLNIEVNMLEEFVESAKAYEVTERSKKEYGRSNSTHVPSKDKPHPTDNRDQAGPSTRPLRGRMFIRTGGRFQRSNLRDKGPVQPSPVPAVNRARSPPSLPHRNSPGNEAPRFKTKPADLSNIKCYRCGEMGHYASSHEKDANPRICAAHTTLRDDIRDAEADDDSTIENGPSEDEHRDYEQSGWQEVEFEEYPGGYNSDEDDNAEFMGMAQTIHSSDGYDGSSDPMDSSEDDDPSDVEQTTTYTTRYLTSRDFGDYTDSEPNYQHSIRMKYTQNTHLNAMTEDGPETRPSTRYKLKIAVEPKSRPMYSASDKMCLSTYTDVNGIMALTLWDSGSTSTAMSPHFADVSKALVFNLVEPVTLQLGTVGSRSKINFGTTAHLELADLKIDEYVDIINIDRYDLLVGTPFMHRHNVVLDFENKCVSISGVNIPAEIIPVNGLIHDTQRHRLWRPIPPTRGN